MNENSAIALTAVVLAVIGWFLIQKHFAGTIPKLAASCIIVVVGFVCFWAFFPETTVLLFGIGRNGGRQANNGLALVKEKIEARDRVVYKITGGTVASAAVSYKNNIRNDGQLWNPQVRFEELKPQEVITAFTRKEWSHRNDTDVDGVPCIPVQLHVAGDKMGRFEIHKPLIYLVPRAYLLEDVQEVGKSAPKAKGTPPAPPAPPRAAPPVNAKPNTVENGTGMLNGLPKPIQTVTLSGEDSTTVNLGQVPSNRVVWLNQAVGLADSPSDAAVTVDGSTVYFQPCSITTFCSYGVSVYNQTAKPQSIEVRNTGRRKLVLAYWPPDK